MAHNNHAGGELKKKRPSGKSGWGKPNALRKQSQLLVNKVAEEIATCELIRTVQRRGGPVHIIMSCSQGPNTNQTRVPSAARGWSAGRRPPKAGGESGKRSLRKYSRGWVGGAAASQGRARASVDAERGSLDEARFDLGPGLQIEQALRCRGKNAINQITHWKYAMTTGTLIVVVYALK